MADFSASSHWIRRNACPNKHSNTFSQWFKKGWWMFSQYRWWHCSQHVPWTSSRDDQPISQNYATSSTSQACTYPKVVLWVYLGKWSITTPFFSFQLRTVIMSLKWRMLCQCQCALLYTENFNLHCNLFMRDQQWDSGYLGIKLVEQERRIPLSLLHAWQLLSFHPFAYSVSWLQEHSSVTYPFASCCNRMTQSLLLLSDRTFVWNNYSSNTLSGAPKVSHHFNPLLVSFTQPSTTTCAPIH